MSPDDGHILPHAAGFDPEGEGGSISWSQVQHYLHAPLRRPWMVVLPFVGVLVLSVAALFLLPKKYRSATLILIESEKVPDSFVPRVATEETSGRLENIKPEILSRTRLEQVLAETNPYPEIASKTRQVETLRDAAAVNQSGADGFTIEFVHENPRKAQEVTDRLATLFIGETVKSRGRQVEDAVDFLVAQVNEARRQLEEKDATLRRYKEQRMGRLPEQLNTNMATLGMLQRELQTVEENIYLSREKQDSLARGVSRRPRSAGLSGTVDEAPDDVDAMRDQLALLRSRYTEEHPDVVSLRARLARTEAKRAVGAQDAPVGADDTLDEVSREQLQRATEEVEKLESRRTELEAQIAALRARVEDTPRTEQELANLTRDYDQLSENYTALLSKQLEAQMAGRLEQRWKGDRFRVLDPAHLPEKPDSPKPLWVLGLGTAFGLLLGLGLSVAAEVFDPTVKDAEQLQALLPCPVLARIPHLPSLQGPAVP